MDLLQRLKEATGHGLTKEEFFRLVDMESKLNEQKKAEGSSSVSSISRPSPDLSKTLSDFSLVDLEKKQNQLKEAFLEMRSTILNQMEEDKLHMKGLLAQAQQDILKAVSAKLEEERRIRKDELGQIRTGIISDVAHKLDEVRKALADKQGQHHSKIMNALAAKAPDSAKGGKKVTATDGQRAVPEAMSKNQIKKMQKQEAKGQSLHQRQQQDQQQQPPSPLYEPSGMALQYPHPVPSSQPYAMPVCYTGQAVLPTGPSLPLSQPPPPPPPQPPAQKQRRPKPKKQPKEPSGTQVHEHHHYYKPEQTEEEKTAEAVKLVMGKIGDAWRSLSTDD